MSTDQTRLTPVPPHVAPHLVVDFDYHTIEGAEIDYHLALRRLHDGPDIIWTPRNGGHWILTRGDDLIEGFKDSDRFSSRSVVIPDVPRPLKALPIEADPPDHAKYRALIQPAFTPKAIAAREVEVRALTVALIEGFKPRGGCEFVSEFAQHLPITVFLNMVGFPLDDRLKLMKGTAEFLDPVDEIQRMRAIQGLIGYIVGKTAERRQAPGDDLWSKVVHSTLDGRPLTDAELIGTGTLLLFGGLDTVVSMLGFFANFLATHPGHVQQLVEDRTLIPAAIEELVRRHGLSNAGRVVAKDMEFKGVTMRAGDAVMLASALHGLDERKFADPLTVDFKRPGAAQHSAFGQGQHRCIGSNLARVELRVFLEEWLARIPRFALKPGEHTRMASGVNGGVMHLPLVWDLS
jgi:cytochrome P450